MWIASLVLVCATSDIPRWYGPTPRELLEEAPRSVEARRDRSLHPARVLVRVRGDRRARRFVRERKKAIQRCAKWAAQSWWLPGTIHPAAMLHADWPTLGGFEVSFAGDGSVSVDATETGRGSISEACIVEALTGHDRRETVFVVVFRQGAKSYRDPEDGHWDSVWQARQALGEGDERLREAVRARAEVEALRAEMSDEDGRARLRVVRREWDLCKAQAAALAFFRVAKELDRRPELEVYLGRAYERLGESRWAAEAYSRYVEGRSDAPDVDEFRRRIARLRRQPDDPYRPVPYGLKDVVSRTSVRSSCRFLARAGLAHSSRR